MTLDQDPSKTKLNLSLMGVPSSNFCNFDPQQIHLQLWPLSGFFCNFDPAVSFGNLTQHFDLPSCTSTCQAALRLAQQHFDWPKNCRNPHTRKRERPKTSILLFFFFFALFPTSTLRRLNFLECVSKWGWIPSYIGFWGVQIAIFTPTYPFM